MTDWLRLVVLSALVGPTIMVLGNQYLKGVIWGSPRALAAVARIHLMVSSAPPTTLFRWRVGVGLQVVVYDEKTDEEKEMPSGLRPDREGPGLIFWWWGERPRSAAFVAQQVRKDFLIRLFCFFCFFLGGFVALVRLASTENSLWLAALVFLACHQIATAATQRYILWKRPWHYVAMTVGVFVYLQGGVFETVAAWAVSAHFVLSTLATWYVMTSSRMRNHYRALR